MAVSGGTAKYEPLPKFIESERQAILTSVVYIFGLICGIVWLTYLWGEPKYGITQSTDTILRSSLHRFVRLLGPLMLILVSPLAWNRRLIKSPVGGLFLLVFFVIPLLAAAVSLNKMFFIYGAGSILISGLILMVFLTLGHDEFSYFFAGVGTVAFIGLILGLVEYGLATSTFYGRYRSHLGMRHPIATCSLIFGSLFFLGFLIKKSSDRLSAPLVFSLKVGLILGLIFFIFMASSRTAFWGISVGLMFYLIASIKGLHRHAVRLFALLVLCGPIGLYGLAYLSGSGLIGTSVLPVRMDSYYAAIQASLYVPGSGGGFGAQAFTLGEFTRGVARFAQVDSVYLTYCVLFGLSSGMVFFAFLYAIALRLIEVGSHVALGVWACLMILFATDAQGFTSSNIVLFLMFGFVLRAAINQKKPPTLPLSLSQNPDMRA